MAGTPLDTESVSAAVTGTLETMEAVGLTGGGYAEAGLVNQPTTGTNRVQTMDASATFAASTSTDIRNLINGRISAVIERSRETLGRNISTGMTVYLPGEQYDLLTTRYIGDNAERTLMASIIADNPWTHFTGGSPLMIQRVLELDSAMNPGSTRRPHGRCAQGRTNRRDGRFDQPASAENHGQGPRDLCAGRSEVQPAVREAPTQHRVCEAKSEVSWPSRSATSALSFLSSLK